eukprot:1311560-Rhodomonas_salina.1
MAAVRAALLADGVEEEEEATRSQALLLVGPDPHHSDSLLVAGHARRFAKLQACDDASMSGCDDTRM